MEPTGRRGALLGGVAVAAAGLLAALALVFTNSTGITEVAASADLQQRAESALGAAAAARNALGQALIVASSDPHPAILGSWLAEARAVVVEMEARVAAVAEVAPPEADLPSRAAATAAQSALDAIGEGDPAEAGSLATGIVADSFSELTDSLVAVRDDAARSIAAASLEAGSVATASRFMVAFLLPSVSVIAVIVVARRRRRRERLAADLERERSINRSKDQLIANISHELRTPLTGIYTSALALEETDYGDPTLSRELNGMIISQSADLTRMVEDLLVSAQAEAGRLSFAIEPVDVAREVSEVEHEIARIGGRVRWRVTAAPVAADPGRLRQVLRNLLSNAVRHGGSTITVRGGLGPGGYRLEVVDDGPGIPPEVEGKLFERFVHDGDRPLIVGSVGLGLAITRVLVEGMGGTISYRRVNGHTVFEILLPSAGADAAA